MDAIVQLALIEKAKRVFGSDGAVELCFPLLSPISFTAAELAGIARPETAEAYAAAADFARSVNFIPHDIVASASDTMVWDVYENVMELAKVPSGTGDPAATPRPSILRDIQADGTAVESAAMRRYRQYRDAWIVVSEDYAARKLSGELSDDPAVQRQWRSVDEPALRAAVENARRDWTTLGQRSAIETAQAADRASALAEPSLRWAEWTTAFDPNVDLVTDGGGSRYGPTGFSPRNFVEKNDWLSFELSASEIAALVAAAPAALKAVLGDQAPTTIEKVTFEYRSVALVRPWFKPEAIASRIWRSDDPLLQLSDGRVPPSGVCPGYATACVFIRNVVQTHAGSAPTAQPGTLFTLDAQVLTSRMLSVDPQLFARASRIELAVAAPVSAPVAEMPSLMATRAFRAIDLASLSMIARDDGGEQGGGDTAEAAASPPAEAAPIAAEIPPEASLDTNEAMLLRPAGIASLAIKRMPAFRYQAATLASQSAPQPAPPPEPAPVVTPPRDEISVLAFIWKRFPKTPDPAAGLTWT